MQIACPNCGGLLECPTPPPPDAKCQYCGAIFSPTEVQPYRPPQPYGLAPTYGVPSDMAPVDAAEAVKGPAFLLLVVGVFDCLGALASFGMGVIGLTVSERRQDDLLFVAMFMGFGVILIAVAALIILGAVRMMRLQSFGLAMTSSILAMLPCLSTCCLLGLPAGIWALMQLNKPEVRSAFHRAEAA